MVTLGLSELAKNVVFSKIQLPFSPLEITII